MINFRKMTVEDMEYIYGDTTLRQLITVEPKGEKFAIVAVDNGEIIGGISGFIENATALTQCIVMKEGQDKETILDGLIRSTIHILELDGVVHLFTTNLEAVNESVGFRPYKGEVEVGSLIENEIKDKETIFINLPDFFKK